MLVLNIFFVLSSQKGTHFIQTLVSLKQLENLGFDHSYVCLDLKIFRNKVVILLGNFFG